MRLLRRGESAPSLDLLVAGLGNPGKEYARTRHNVGHMVVDELARRHGASFRSKFSGDVSDVRLTCPDRAAQAATYRNESGRSVGRRGRSKVPPGSCSRHDEVDLELGGSGGRGGAGGQTGSAARQHLARRSSAAARRRGRPERGDPRPVADWVLSPFDDTVDVEGLVARAADAVETIARDGVEEAQQRFNERL